MIKLVLCLMLVAQTSAIHSTGQAKADQVDGVFIFVSSKPTEPYIDLGAIKRGGFLEQPSDMLPKLVKQAKKKYPECTGLIVDINFEKAEMITFK